MTRQGVSKILGKRIVGVIEKACKRGTFPVSQIFLLFDDNTYYEFYSDARIIGTNHVDDGGIAEVQRYGSDAYGIVFQALSKQ
jgi:hypothetical protein